nr:hypothetical protein GCM10020093_105930 [Planobispora longispora]
MVVPLHRAQRATVRRLHGGRDGAAECEPAADLDGPRPDAHSLPDGDRRAHEGRAERSARRVRGERGSGPDPSESVVPSGTPCPVEECPPTDEPLPTPTEIPTPIPTNS